MEICDTCSGEERGGVVEGHEVARGGHGVAGPGEGRASGRRAGEPAALYRVSASLPATSMSTIVQHFFRSQYRCQNVWALVPTWRRCPGWRGAACWAAAWRPAARARGRGARAWGACQVWPWGGVIKLTRGQGQIQGVILLCAFSKYSSQYRYQNWRTLGTSAALGFVKNCCFSLIYKVFIAAFNLYNPAYLSLLYNIYLAFLWRVYLKQFTEKLAT